jgi:hypothetical protein
MKTILTMREQKQFERNIFKKSNAKPILLHKQL